MPLSAVKRKTQINIYGIDPAMRNKFKAMCRRFGYPMNEVFLEIIDYLLMDDKNLKKFFTGHSKYQEPPAEVE